MEWTSHPIAANTSTGIPIRFKPENVVKYEGSTLKVFRPGDLYVPTSSKQLAFDAWNQGRNDGFLLTTKAPYDVTRGEVAFRLHHPPWVDDHLR
jgi:hypothetical protein